MMLPVTEAVTKRLSGTRSSTSWSLIQLLRSASLQCGWCSQDQTVQHLHDAGFGSVDSLTNIALCNRRLTFVRFISCHCCNVLAEADNSVKLVVFLSKGFAIHASNHVFCHLTLARCCVAYTQIGLHSAMFIPKPYL